MATVGDTRVRVLISGKVQGVWFRGWTQRAAETLGLSGWVRNLSDGRVEAVFAGPKPKTEEMLERCRQGPPLARVESVEVDDHHGPLEPGFHTRPTI
ncbi:acylphosphatase [Algihabitans albus]|uniref:acylphosphatase n=1 Tax=Algihabitans albus TaxID=2164067 RepID=UPI000E5C5847|nr:acylphosphatase [Algihabitans albus]